jgi:preprotein translocase subunit SecE
MNTLTTYLKESVVELKKVTWPTQTQTRNYTLLVLGITIGMALFLGALDTIFNLGLQSLLTRGL